MIKENERILKVGGHSLHLTNQRKIYFPDVKCTKGDVLDYYDRIYKYIIPYLKNRPESLRRTPNGMMDEGFFQKNAGNDTPSWVPTVSVYSKSGNREIKYIVCNDKATLFYLNNLGCIEFNTWFSQIKKLEYPDYTVIDLDPSPSNSFEQVIEAALAVKEALDKAGATGYCKTSGATGLHIYIPLGAKYSFSESQEFSNLIATLAQEYLPKTTSLERCLTKRGRKIYLDYLQNRVGQTLAAPYSLRPKPGATASAPLLWKEVKKGLHPSMFNIKTLVKRVEKKGDLFSGVLGKGVDMKRCLKKLGA